MKILLAINDRDLLSSLDSILTIEGFETDTAFDGVQAISLLSRKNFDLAVIDEYITLLTAKKIAETCKNEFNTKTILLCDKKTGDGFADAEIKYPFVSGEFISIIHSLSGRDPDTITDDQGEVNL